MSAWREAHEEGMFAAAEAHDRLDIDTSVRVDVFSAIEELGLTLFFRPLRGVSGLYAPGGDGATGGILVSSFHPLSRRRFTAAHELGHFWLGHRASLDREVELLARGEAAKPREQEMVADAFAAWFLMPPELVDLELERLGVRPPLSPAAVYALALRLGTSFTATAYHLVNLRLAERSHAAACAATNLASLKRDLSGGHPLASPHNDVWLLAAPGEPTQLHPSAGDRLVLAAEHEGRWHPRSLPDGCSVTALAGGSEVSPDLEISGLLRGTALIVDLFADGEGPAGLAVDFEAHGIAGPPSSFRARLQVESRGLGRYRPGAPLTALRGGRA